MSEMYDEYHEYRVDTQRWTKWPKALIMTHEWSTNGHDRRLEQRRYVPDDYAQEVKRKNYSLQSLVDLYQQEARRALDDERQTRSNVNRLRDRVHEIAADRDRIKAENEKLKDACTRLFDIAHAADLELDREILETGLVVELQKLGVDAEI